MPDFFYTRFEAAAARAETWLRTRGIAFEAENTSGRFRRKFHFTRRCGTRDVALDLLLPRDYPIAPPRLRVDPIADYYLHFPHVESDGLVCLFDNASEFNVADVEAVLDEVFRRIDQIIGQPDFDNFFTEFHSYWSNSPQKVHLLTDLAPDVVKLVGVIGAGGVYVAGGRDQLLKWVANYLEKDRSALATTDIPILRLSTPLAPLDFPTTVTELLALAKKVDLAVYEVITEHLTNGRGDAAVVIRFDHKTETIIAGVRFPGLRLGDQKDIYYGHRRGHVAASLAVSRGRSQLEGATVARLQTVMSTHAYLHARGGAGYLLEGKTVTLVGCGSLGGYVAHLLARAGVGHLHLIDPQALDWDNAGRHVLGGTKTSTGKAAALAARLGAELPHLTLTPHPLAWIEVWREKPKVFLESNLIISTVGHWNTEHDLNVLARRENGFPPVLFSWIEPHAVVGHGLLVHPTLGGCLGCGSSVTGDFLESVCLLNGEHLRRGAGCGDFYQPYGVAEMMPVAALAAQFAIDALLGENTVSELRSWTGPADLFTRHRLNIREDWQSHLAANPAGAIRRKEWPVNLACPYCH